MKLRIIASWDANPVARILILDGTRRRISLGEWSLTLGGIHRDSLLIMIAQRWKSELKVPLNIAILDVMRCTNSWIRGLDGVLFKHVNIEYD